MKGGTVFLAASATSTCGFTAGADPPVAGCEWQPTHESRLKRGPRPSDRHADFKDAFVATKRIGSADAGTVLVGRGAHVARSRRCGRFGIHGRRVGAFLRDRKSTRLNSSHL